MASTHVLSAQSLSSIIAQSLPLSASPQLQNPYDAVAVAAHATMAAVGFRLIGLDEDDRLPAADQLVRRLPDNWNAHSPNSYSFKYAHTQSSMEFLLRVNRMGKKAVVMGMGIGDDKTATFDVKVDEYISESSLPASPSKDEATPTNSVASTPASPPTTSTEDDVSPTPKPIRDAVTAIYISPGRLSDFGALSRLNLIQKLLPSLHKPGYEETSPSSSTTTARQPGSSNPPRNDPQPARPQPHHDPLALPPRLLRVAPDEFAPPGFEDEYDVTRPPRPFHPAAGGFGIGERDLYPQGLGPNDPFRPMGPGLGGGGMGGGMYPDFGDPLFTGQGRGGGGAGAGGYDPTAPPGARHDPVGPGGQPRGSGGGGFGGMPRNPFGGFGSGDFI